MNWFSGAIVGLVGVQVEHTKAGIEAISQAKVTVKQLRENFLLIDKQVLRILT